jgi:hypothetical protein
VQEQNRFKIGAPLVLSLNDLSFRLLVLKTVKTMHFGAFCYKLLKIYILDMDFQTANGLTI